MHSAVPSLSPQVAVVGPRAEHAVGDGELRTAHAEPLTGHPVTISYIITGDAVTILNTQSKRMDRGSRAL